MSEGVMELEEYKGLWRGTVITQPFRFKGKETDLKKRLNHLTRVARRVSENSVCGFLWWGWGRTQKGRKGMCLFSF